MVPTETPIARAFIRRGNAAVRAVALVATLVTARADADTADALNFAAGSSLKHDANVFLVPDSADPPQGFSTKSDYVNVNYVAVHVDKPYAQQRFLFDVTETVTRYRNFSSLDSNALDYRAAWLWTLTPNWTGTLSVDRAQAPLSLLDVGGTESNEQTTTNGDFKIDASISGGWHLLAAYGQTDLKTEHAVIGQPSYRNHRLLGGVRFATAAGNTITFTYRSIPTDVTDQDLDPVNLIDTSYRDTEAALAVKWAFSETSIVDGTLNRVERRNDHFSQRDFSGTAGVFRYAWNPTSKLKFDFAASRALLPYAAFGNAVENSTYKVDRALSMGAIWQVTAKTALRLNVGRTLSDYRGPVFAITEPARKDNYSVAQFGVEWVIQRYLTLTAGIERDRRTSNVAGFEFNDNIATVGAVLSF